MIHNAIHLSDVLHEVIEMNWGSRDITQKEECLVCSLTGKKRSGHKDGIGEERR